jgi:UbiD family decarboxylase
MSFSDFQTYLRALESAGELHRTQIEIDPVLELTEVAVRAIREGKPALLVEKPAGSAFPLVINHYASSRRIELALGKHPAEFGHELVGFLESAFPPAFGAMLERKSTLMRLLRSRPKDGRPGIAQEIAGSPDLSKLPVQMCWPEDGGRFITYGQVITYDPAGGRRNMGIYRMQLFDNATTGMHWQIQKGGGFHYHRALAQGKDFEIAVALGTSPALLLATVAPLPEGLDEAMFAGFLENRRIRFTRGRTVSINVPSSAEFILEGKVPAGETRLEGPFGDHFGHYSAASEFPVFRISAITHRKNPVYPATVVGRPPMEDKFLGDATQEMLGGLIRLIHKEVRDLWAYYEAGFHNLLVASIEQRYQKEAMKAALGLMGTDQLSLAKCIITVTNGTDTRDFRAVLNEIYENFDPRYDFIMIPKVPLDTLDFTSYTMNLGSKMIIDATRKSGRQGRKTDKERIASRIKSLGSEDGRILDLNLLWDTMLLVKVSPGGGRGLLEKLLKDPGLGGLPLVAAVSEDVDIFDKESYIWGVFTRFDCERDVLFTEQKLTGISPSYGGIMGIDATWKPGYPEPLSMTPEITRRVDEKWGKIWR